MDAVYPRNLVTFARCFTCIITEAPEDANGIARGDKVVVHTKDTLPSPPGIYIVSDGWAVGMAHVAVFRTPEGPKFRVSRPNMAELVVPIATLGILGRVVARWAWL